MVVMLEDRKIQATKEDLLAFTQGAAEAFNAGRIRAPVHLNSPGQLEPLMDFFAGVRARDWVFTTYRAHWHCLLKGVPPNRLMEEVLAGRSISLCFPEHRVFSSAIVGGHLPMAVGVAEGIQRLGLDEVVYAFLGDMAHRSGLAFEAMCYAGARGLPIEFVVEDNGMSVCTPTVEAWGPRALPTVHVYQYAPAWPHSGAGRRVEF